MTGATSSRRSAGVHDGLNWTPQGQAILGNGCNWVPVPVPNPDQNPDEDQNQDT